LDYSASNSKRQRSLADVLDQAQVDELVVAVIIAGNREGVLLAVAECCGAFSRQRQVILLSSPLLLRARDDTVDLQNKVVVLLDVHADVRHVRERHRLLAP
jgi:hypothetical protein